MENKMINKREGSAVYGALRKMRNCVTLMGDISPSVREYLRINLDVLFKMYYGGKLGLMPNKKEMRWLEETIDVR